MRLALHGGLFSGKSTLAKELEARGFTYVNYTRYLKVLYARSLCAVGIQMSADDVERDKERERPHIISFGSRIGFDKGNFVEECLDEEASSVSHPAGMGGNDGLYPDIVFDNVRFDTQMEKLLPLGFRLVRLDTPFATRAARAALKGVDQASFAERCNDPSEAPLSYFPGEVSISVEGDIDTILNTLTWRLGMAQLTELLLHRQQSAAHAAD